MKFDRFYKTFLAILLAGNGYFLMQTFATIKSLEKDIITIREKISAFEATRLTRQDILEMISDYHENHPCIRTATEYADFTPSPRRKRPKTKNPDTNKPLR